ncbi:MAG: hypothetical protein KM310_00545 [Clostridiales bacterium]|nr:hypothetical protein [Clostridiales bacterium]
MNLEKDGKMTMAETLDRVLADLDEALEAIDEAGSYLLWDPAEYPYHKLVRAMLGIYWALAPHQGRRLQHLRTEPEEAAMAEALNTALRALDEALTAIDEAGSYLLWDPEEHEYEDLVWSLRGIYRALYPVLNRRWIMDPPPEEN